MVFGANLVAPYHRNQPLANLLLPVLVAIIAAYILQRWLLSTPIPSYTVSAPTIAEKQDFENGCKDADPESAPIRCYAPATGRFLGHVAPTTRTEIDEAIDKAHVAQERWARTSFEQRRQVLRTLLRFILDNKEEICRIACLDSGKTMIDASLGEILVTLEKLKWTIDHGEKALQPERRPTNFLMLYKENYVHYEPLGVVAALVSWNYPFHNLIGPVISAIFAGNGIVVKASENTAWSANYFASIAKKALSVCGHDPDLVQSIVCWPKSASHLTSHPRIAHITFIGSKAVAHKVARSAADALIPNVAELGGKDAAIVLDSAQSDVPRIVEILLRGTFQASGQNCIGIERIILCPAVYDTISTQLATRIHAIRVGSGLDATPEMPVDMGAMISSASFDRLEHLIEAAVTDGASLLVGGHRLQHSRYPQGFYFQPTLLVDVTPNMAIAKEECFGPICVVMRARDHKHAIEIANAGDFGLGASVFGKESKERRQVVHAMKTGMVAVNDFAAYYAVQLPFGGQRGSGYGRFAGEEGLRGLCNIKAICRDRWGWAGISTAIPPGVRYPINDTAKGFAFTGGVLELGYGLSLWEKFRGLANLIRNS